MSAHISNVRPEPDQVLVDIADYVLKYKVTSARGLRDRPLLPDGHARLRLRGARVPGLHQAARARSSPAPSCPTAPRCPARQFQLDPVQAAFNIGAMIRWLDFNDTWLAAEWGHPSDNLGGILATADWLSRNAVAAGKKPLTVQDVLTAMIKAHEIQGVHRAREQLQPRRPRPRGAGEGRLHRRGRADARAARATRSSTRCRYAWVDGQSLRTYRHAPNTGSRKSWAAGDATSRAVRLALIAKTGEMGYPSVLTRQDLGLLRRALQGQAVQVPAPLRQLRDGERAVQDLLPGRVPLADRGGVRDDAPPAARKAGQDRSTTSSRSRSARTRRASASSTRRARSTTRPTATTASSTWSPCRSSSAASPPPTTRTRWRRTRASTRCATRSCASRTRSSRGTTTTPTSARSPTRSRWSSGRHEAQGDRGRVPDRPQAPAQGRHAGAGREVPHQPRAALPGEAAQGDPRALPRREAAGRHAGATSSST